MEKSCESIQEQIPELITDTLPAETEAELQHHISQCQVCSEYLQAIKADDTLLGEFAKAMQPILTRIENKVISTQDVAVSKKPVQSVLLFGIVTKGRLIKFVAAAIIVTCVLKLSNDLNGSFNGSTRVLANAFENMKQSSWVYSIIETQTPQGKDVRHVWKSFDAHIDVIKEQDGTIRYMDYSKEVEYVYNPNSRTITLSFQTDDYMLSGPKTPFEMLSRMIESFDDRKAKLAREKTSANGIEVELIHVAFNDDHQDESMLLVRDIRKNLLIRMEIKAVELTTGEEFTSVTTFEYPERGPDDIYAVGAPRDATIVDIRPEGLPNVLVERIQNKFEEGFGEHIAVVLTSRIKGDGGLEPSSVDVLRQKGNLKRIDRYRAYDFQNGRPRLGTLYKEIKDNWPNLTIPQILKLEKEDALEYRALFDDKQTVTLHESINGTLTKQNKAGDIFKIRMEDSLAGLTWTIPHRQIMNGSSRIKRDLQLLSKDPNHPDLVGFRLLKFAQTDEYWFDPNKDYILIEYVSRQHGTPPPLRTIVAQTGRTPDGKWYPKVIRTKSVYLNSEGTTESQSWEKHVLLDTNPSFQEGIFDADNLTEYRDGNG